MGGAKKMQEQGQKRLFKPLRTCKYMQDSAGKLYAVQDNAVFALEITEQGLMAVQVEVAVANLTSIPTLQINRGD